MAAAFATDIGASCRLRALGSERAQVIQRLLHVRLCEGDSGMRRRLSVSSVCALSMGADLCWRLSHRLKPCSVDTLFSLHLCFAFCRGVHGTRLLAYR